MLKIIILIIIGLTAIAAFIQQFKHDSEPLPHINRLIAVGFGAIAIALVGDFAIAVRNLLLGLGGAVILCELYYLLGLNSKKKWLDSTIDYLPVLIPFAFVYPYMSFISYFVGIDIGIIVCVGFVITAYALLIRVKRIPRQRLSNTIITLTALIMIIWTIISL